MTDTTYEVRDHRTTIQVLASITRTGVDGYTGTHHLPTFFLDRGIQGIVSLDGAALVARDIVDPFHAADVGLYITDTVNGEAQSFNFVRDSSLAVIPA